MHASTTSSRISMAEAGRVRREGRATRTSRSQRERAERTGNAAGDSEKDAAVVAAALDADSERRLARTLALFGPVVIVATAVVVGELTSLGLALLVLAGGALFGTVAFFWASLRTLGGDAPLAEGFDQMARRSIEAPDSPAERKRAALRGLKDLEFEHALGKIDDADYAELSAHYREEAKAILRELDLDVAPRRERAEELARSYLAKRGIRAKGAEAPASTAPTTPSTESSKEKDAAPASVPRTSTRIACRACSVANERDAVFCKGCGARLQSFECAACATVNEPDAAFCKKCGKGLAVNVEEKSDVAR
jgi:rRNA maturation endonuclease Nob1